MLYSQARRIRWCELFDAQHGFLVESLGADAEDGGLAPKQVITQVREAIRDAVAAFRSDPGPVALASPATCEAIWLAIRRRP